MAKKKKKKVTKLPRSCLEYFINYLKANYVRM